MKIIAGAGRPTRLAVALVLLGCDGGDPAVVRAMGTVEVVEVDVAAMVPARVVTMRVEEGDHVRAGDTIAQLTQASLQADLELRRARLATAEANLRDLLAGARSAEIERAEAELRAAEADAARAARDAERLTELAASEIVSQQQLDAARSAARTAASRRDAASEALRLVRQGARPERIRGARAEVESARAGVEAARATASDLVLTAPLDGVVLGRHAEPGEVLGAGSPVATVGELRRPWVRVYVAQRDLPRVQIGQRAVARVDAFPDREFPGRVTAISGRAEYTPRVALTEDERADLMFAVKVEFRDTSGVLKPGLPAEVRLMTAPEANRETP